MTDEQLSTLEAMRDSLRQDAVDCFPFDSNTTAAMIRRADILDTAITYIRETKEMLEDADGIQFEFGFQISRGLLKWRFVDKQDFNRPPLYDSPQLVYKALKETKP